MSPPPQPDMLSTNKRKPSRDIPAYSEPPNEKYTTQRLQVVDEVAEQLNETSLNSVPAFTAPHRILNSEDMDADEAALSTLPKDARPIQPDDRREYFERLWAQNFERSEVQYIAPVANPNQCATHYIPVGERAELLVINGFSLARDSRTAKSYVVFRLEMECKSQEKRWTVYRRFHDFKKLNDQLKAQGYRTPHLPPKTLLRSFGNEFLVKRQADLQKWLQDILNESSKTSAASNFSADVMDSDILRRFLTHMANTPPPLDENVGKIDRTSSAGSSEGCLSMMREPEPEPVKLTVDDFDFLRVVGKGSFGKVLLVQKKDSLELFAMKILSKPTVVKKNQVEHTRTERRVLASVKHPFIVQLHYAFQTSKKLYFILDYCPGGDMFFHLSRYGSFPELMAKFYAAEIALALIHLHELGVIYRDLKPENIMLDVEGHVKLADFGLAKEGITGNVEGTNTMCGTPEYLPPEILNRNGHGKAVDWWNLGMVLYEFLTGRPPWYTTDRMKLFLRLRRAKLEFPDGMSMEAMSLISGLLNRNPAERLGSRSGKEVLDHPFFQGVDWQMLYNREITPPFQPCQFTDPQEAANFESTFTQIPVHEDEEGRSSLATPSGRGSALRALSYTFQGFTFEGGSDQLPF